MKAFLSHSSHNKEFVRSVAENLGRVKSYFDETSFEDAGEISEQINKGMDASSIFVFFASEESLNHSFWCQYEIQEAFYRILQNKFRKILVYIISPSIKIEELPEWMKRNIIKTSPRNPSKIAREIQYHIQKQLQTIKPLGRGEFTQLIEDIIHPINSSPPAQIFAITGLNGIGRKSIIREYLISQFNLHKTVEIEINDGDGIKEICIMLSSLIEKYSCKEELDDKIKLFDGLDNDTINETILNYLSDLIEGDELPIFIDNHGILDRNGTIKRDFDSLFSYINSYSGIYLAIVANKRIQGQNNEIVSLSVSPLTNKATKQLLIALCNRYNIQYEQSQIDKLSEFIDGYPPAAYYAIEEVKQYGFDSVIGNTRSLTQYKQKLFLSYVESLDLNDASKTVIRLLNSFSPLPYQVIIELFKEKGSHADIEFAKLIDYSLIILDEDRYRISTPLIESLNKSLGMCSKVEINLLITKLKPFIKNLSEDKSPYLLDYARVLGRLALWTGDDELKGISISLNSDQISILEQLYHKKHYSEAISLGFFVVEKNESHIKSRTILIKSLIQEEKWEDAFHQIDLLSQYDTNNSHYYLKGFLYRKKGEFENAIEDLKKAYDQTNFTPFILERELAHCHFMLGEYEVADKYIKKALITQSRNSYLIDMAAKFAIQRRDKENSLKYLKQLEMFDNSEFYKMRASSYYLKIEINYDLAISLAEESVHKGGRSFFAGRVQLIHSLIKANLLDRANIELTYLQRDFKNKNHDLIVALFCILEIQKGAYQKLLILSSDFRDKTSVKAKGFRKMALEKLSVDYSINYKTRNEYQNELNSLSCLDVSQQDLEERFL